MLVVSDYERNITAPTESKRIPKAVADGIGGMILAVA
jgi:hypothetical protein